MVVNIRRKASTILAHKLNRMLSSTPVLPFFRSLLQSSPTFPFDPYRWRRDDRTAGEKVVGGIRLGLGLVAGFVVLVLASRGISTLPRGAPAYGSYGPFVSWGMVCLATVILFLTANRWASIGAGFFCVPALFKSLAVLAFGTNPSSSIPYHRLTRIQAAEILFVCVIVIGLTWRFAKNHPAPTTFLDRIALTFFVLVTIKQMMIPYSWPPALLISGLGALFVAWCVHRWQQAGRIRKHHRRSASTFEKLTES
jgi:hypothetical protein